MAFWRTIPLQRQAEWAASLRSVLFSPRLASPARRASLIQWTVVGAVSVILGIYAIGAASLPSRWLPLAVLAALCPVLVAIVGDARRLFLALIIMDIPFATLLDFNFGYRLDVEKLGAFAGLNISITTISLVVLYALWLGELLAKAQTLARPVVRPSLPLALYVAFVALSLTVTHDLQLSLYMLFLLVQTFLLFVYIVGTVRSQQDVLFIVTMLLIGLCLESAIMIGSLFLGHGAGIGGSTGAGTGGAGQYDWRSRGTLGSPIVAASYLSLLLGPAIGLLLVQGARVGRLHKWLAALALGLGGPALLLTGSRGGLIVLAVSGAMICLLAWRRGWLPKMAPFAVAIVLMGALVSLPLAFLVPLPFGDLISERLGAGENGRGPLIQLALQMIRDHPVLGVGVNNFAVMIKDYATPEFSSRWLYTVHNKYLSIWAETGIGALIAFLWFLGATIGRGWRGSSLRSCDSPGAELAYSSERSQWGRQWGRQRGRGRRQGSPLHNRFLSPLILAFTAGMIGQALHMFEDVFNDRSQVQLLWLVAGLVTAMSSMARLEASATRATLPIDNGQPPATLMPLRIDRTMENPKKPVGPNIKDPT